MTVFATNAIHCNQPCKLACNGWSWFAMMAPVVFPKDVPPPDKTAKALKFSFSSDPMIRTEF